MLAGRQMPAVDVQEELPAVLAADLDRERRLHGAHAVENALRRLDLALLLPQRALELLRQELREVRPAVREPSQPPSPTSLRTWNRCTLPTCSS